MTRDEVRILVILLAFLVSLSLPLSPYVPAFVKGALPAYLLFPCLVLLLMKKNPLALGLGPGNWARGLKLTVWLSFGILAGCFLLSLSRSMQFYYYPARWGMGSAEIIALAEGKRAVQLVGWEFLFRGFLLFGLCSSLGNATGNGIQAALCALTHMNKPPLEFYGSFPFALLLGTLALKTRSVWYGFFLHWLLGFSLEAFIALGKQGFL